MPGWDGFSGRPGGAWLWGLTFVRMTGGGLEMKNAPGFPEAFFVLAGPDTGAKSRVVGRGFAAPAGRGLEALVRPQSIFGSVSNW